MAFTLVDLSGGVGAGGGGEIVINLELQEKTVDSSSNIQHVKPTDGYIGLKEVTVNPVTLQNKTVDSSTVSQEIVSDASVTGLNKVTVNPYVLDEKTVDSSTVAQDVTSDADGLSKVTINPLVLSPLELDSSTMVQESEGLYNSVRVNPYVLDSSSAVIEENGEYVFTSGVDGLSRVDVSVNIDTSTYYNNGYTAGETAGIAEGIAQQKALLDSSTFTANATYRRADGWDEITVAVPIPTFTTQSKTVDSSTNSQEVEPDSGYDGLSKVTVNPYVLDSSTVDPSTNQITVTSAEDGLSSVTVNAVTSAIDANIAAGNIKNGVTILGVQGTYIGTVINNQNKSIDSSTSAQSVTYDSGYTGLGTVTITALNLDSIYNTLASY